MSCLTVFAFLQKLVDAWKCKVRGESKISRKSTSCSSTLIESLGKTTFSLLAARRVAQQWDIRQHYEYMDMGCSEEAELDVRLIRPISTSQ